MSFYYIYTYYYILFFTFKPVTRTTKQVLSMSVAFKGLIEPYSASPLAAPISFASQMSFSLLVFDDTAATPVDKPFHAVFPMDVAQVRVSHIR